MTENEDDRDYTYVLSIWKALRIRGFQYDGGRGKYDYRHFPPTRAASEPSATLNLGKRQLERCPQPLRALLITLDQI